MVVSHLGGKGGKLKRKKRDFLFSSLLFFLFRKVRVISMLRKTYTNNLHDLVLLKSLTRKVEGKVLRVDDTLDEAEPLRNEVSGIVSDEHTADVELDVVLGLLGLEEVERSALGHKEDGLELKLTLNREVLDGEVVLPVVGERLVEGGILLLSDVLGVASPDGLLLAEKRKKRKVRKKHLHNLVGKAGILLELLLLSLDLLDLLGLGLLLLVLLIVLDLLDLGLLVVTLLDGLGLLIGDLDLGLLLNVEVDGVRDELRVLLDHLLDLGLIEVISLLILEVEDDLGAAANGGAVVGGDVESATSAGLPDVLLVIIVLGDNGDSVGNEVGRVETDTELTDHGNISASGESLHELLGAGAGNGAKVVDEVSLGHTDTGILDGQSLVLLVGDDVDAEILASVQLAGVGQRLIADLVEGIGGVGDKFSEEDLLVGVDCVDDEGEKLRDLSLELESLSHLERVSEVESGVSDRFESVRIVAWWFLQSIFLV